MTPPTERPDSMKNAPILPPADTTFSFTCRRTASVGQLGCFDRVLCDRMWEQFKEAKKQRAHEREYRPVRVYAGHCVCARARVSQCMCCGACEVVRRPSGDLQRVQACGIGTLMCPTIHIRDVHLYAS